VRSNFRGIALIELLVVVILISTVATAYLNFRDDTSRSKSDEPRMTVLDSALYAALDIIALDLRLARQAPGLIAGPLAVEHLGYTDRLTIRRNNCQNKYLINEHNQLIRQTDSTRQRLAEEVLSLKAQKMGKETIVLTLTANSKGESLNGSGDIARSYSRVVTVNFTL
jgi:type II secretory pathway component PulJ